VEVPALEIAQILDSGQGTNWFAVFAPDGKTVAAGGSEGVLRLWDLASGKVASVGKASKDSFRSGALSPDGRTLATGRAGGSLTVWDVPGARALRSIKKHSAAIRTVQFTPDGKLLVASGQDRTLTVWDTSTWTVVRRLPEQPQPILSSTLSPDGKLLAIALGDPTEGGEREGAVRLYDFETLQERGELPGIDHTVWAVGFSPDGRTLATGRGRVLELWNPSTRQLRSRTRVVHNIRVLAFTADGKTLATAGSASASGTIQLAGAGQLLDVATLQTRATVPGHGTLIVGVSFSPDGGLLSTASVTSAEVRLWDASKLPPPPAPAAAAAPATGTPAASAPEGALQLLAAGLPVAGSPPLRFHSVFMGHADDVWVAVFAPDARTLATGGNDCVVRLWEPETGRELASLKLSRELRAAAYSPDGRWLATGCSNGVAQVWDLSQRRSIATLPKRRLSIRTVAFAPDGKTLAAEGDDKSLVLYDTSTWQAIRTLAPQEEQVLGLAYSPDGKTLAIATGRAPWGRAGSVKLVDPTSLEERRSLPVDFDAWAVAFSPDGKLLATTSQSLPDPVRLWDVATGSVLRPLKPVSPARRIVFAPDGATLAVGQLDGTISVFESATGRLIAAIRGHATAIFGLGISPDGKLLATGSADGTVKLWDLPATAGEIGKE
jgi:WD40 repeat protein